MAATDDRDLLKQLASVDWQFPDAWTTYGLHSLHWYPATYIPQLPAYLIELLTEENDLVLDPFCGVGTTLVEALRLGRRCAGIDSNPIATLAAKAKITFFDQDHLKQLHHELTRALDALISTGTQLFHRTSHEPPDPHRGRGETMRWYHPVTYRQLQSLAMLISSLQDPNFRRLSTAVFSQVLKACSSQRKHWGYVADNMAPRELVFVDAFAKFRARLANSVSSLFAFRSETKLRAVPVEELNRRATVFLADARSIPLASASVDSILTSPPYLNVTDYTRSQRLSMEWLNLNLEKSQDLEIGARWKRFRARSKTEYLDDLSICFSELRRLLRKGRYLCMVLDEGRRRSPGVLAELKTMAQSSGFAIVGQELRREYKRQRVLDRQGTINREVILLWR